MLATPVVTLRELRRVKGLTAVQLAHRMGLTENTVLRWERGERKPRGERVAELADALHVSEVTIRKALGI